MGDTQGWLFGLIMYFVGTFVVVSLLSLGGAFADNTVSVDTGYDPILKGTAENGTIAAPTQSFIIKPSNYFADVFSFFVFNVSITSPSILVQFLWIIRLLFVYIPLTFLLLTIYYSLPTVSG